MRQRMEFELFNKMKRTANKMNATTHEIKCTQLMSCAFVA